MNSIFILFSAVDCQFNVKIADLELGIASEDKAPRPDGSDDGRDEEEGALGRDPEQVAVSAASRGRMTETGLSLGTPHYMSPEQATAEKTITNRSDIYSLGSVMWEIITGLLPYDNDSQAEIRQKISEGHRHPMPIQYKGTPIASLITRCWSEDPKQRPVGEQVVAELENILSDQCYYLIGDVEGAPQTASLRDFYEQHFRQSNASSVLGDSVHRGGRQHKMSFTSIFSRFHPSAPETQHKLSFDNVNEGPHSSSSDRSSTSSLNRPLLTAGELDNLVRNEETERPQPRTLRQSKSYFSNNMYALRMQAQMPRSALDAIGIVKEEGYWRNLESHGGAWAVVTVEAPHLVMHATSSWYRLFDINPVTISYTRLESLVSLMGTYTTAYIASSGNAAAFTSSNSYVNFSNMEDQEQCVADILAKLEGYQQVHGVSCFHLPSNAEAGRTLGHNMMCTLHAYPIYSSKAWAQLEAAASDTPSKKASFSFRQTLTNLTTSSGRASFATSVRNSSYPETAEDVLASSTSFSAHEEASFSPTDYMGSSLLDTLDDGGRGTASSSKSHVFSQSHSASKPRLLGDFSFRSSMSRSLKPVESVPPLYFAVLFNEMSEQLPPSSAAASKATSPAESASRKSRNNSFDTKSSSGGSGGSGSVGRFNSLQKFRSLITPPKNKLSGGKGGDQEDLLHSRSYSTDI